MTSQNNTKVVYTAIFGDYDKPVKPLTIEEDWDYILFTDNTKRKVPEPWTPIQAPFMGLDGRRKNRFYKLLPHLHLWSYDESLYLDGNFQITGDINEYVEQAGDKSLLIFPAVERDNVYDEALIVAREGLAHPQLIRQQMRRYHQEGFDGRGLCATGVLYRRHNEDGCRTVMERWWLEYYYNTRRDQLSFNYSAWRNNYTYALSDWNIWSNPYFRSRPHHGGRRQYR